MKNQVTVLSKETAIEYTPTMLDKVQIGEYYWVKFDKDSYYCRREESEVVNNELLMCVQDIGSNHVSFKCYIGDNSTALQTVHFYDFEETCRLEPNWKEVFQARAEKAQRLIQEKTQLLIKAGQDLCLIPTEVNPNQIPEEQQSFLPVRVSSSPEKHKLELIELKEKTIPEISKEIEKLGQSYAVAMKSIYTPDMVKLQKVKGMLHKVDDHIFTIELYCGLQEVVEQIQKGEPADQNCPISIYQQILFMDEETLFDYKDGGMDFGSIEKFDAWLLKKENLDRIMPNQRGIVAFRVRRHDKDYGRATTLSQALTQCNWHVENSKTYLIIRNGQNVYRINSAVDFMPRLIPKTDEIGKKQFIEISKQYRMRGEPEPKDKIRHITPEDIDYDEKVREMDSLLQQYNRIVILIQGLLDRTMIFAPHPKINLCKDSDMIKWIDLVRDEEKGLPCNRVTFEDYQKQLNSTLTKGKWIRIDCEWAEGYKDGEPPDHSYRYSTGCKWGDSANPMPRLSMVQSINKERTKVKVSWPKGENRVGKRIWVPSPDRVGWGHYKYDYSSKSMCHEWIDINRVMNVSDYNLGDYRMFLCDRSLQGKYLQWAQYLLPAERFAQQKAKGFDPTDIQKEG
jgi:hypothetical protein